MSEFNLIEPNCTIINPHRDQWNMVCQPHDISVLYNCIIYFTVGLVLSQWSESIVWLIIFIVVYELILAIYHRRDLFDYNQGYYLLDRLVISMSSILGFIVGRTLLGDTNPLKAGDDFSIEDLIFL